MEQPDRNRLTAARLEIEVEDLGLHFARCRGDRGEQRRSLARDDVANLERAGAHLGKVVVEPRSQRSVEIDNIAGRIDREKSCGSMIEIVDRVLQFLEDIFLPLAVPRYIGDRPYCSVGFPSAHAQRAYAHPQPARALAGAPVDPDLLL